MGWRIRLGAGLVLLGLVAAWHPGARADPQVVEPRVAVFVSGAVRRPGVYRLAPGSRLADAIQAAGGAQRGARLGDLELASGLADGQSVRVPAAGERLDPAARTIVALPPSFDPRERVPVRRPVRRARAPTRPPSGRIDLNRASAADLQRLPGVGPGLAARILAYRARSGGFRRAEELREVPGIGERRLARIVPHVDLH